MKIKTILLSIAVGVFAFLSANAQPYKNIVYKLNYKIENNSDSVVIARFHSYSPCTVDKYGDPKYIEKWVDLKPSAQGSNEEDSIECLSGQSGYKIFLGGQEVAFATGPLGPVVSIVHQGHVHQSGRTNNLKYRFSLDSTYNKDTKTAEFKFIINPNLDEKEL